MRAKRQVIQEEIGGLPAGAPELLLVALLDEYRQLREKRLSVEARKVQTASGLLICGLQQRLFSSIEAFARTLRVHRKTVLRQWEAFRSQVEVHAVVPTYRVELLGRGVGSDDDRALLSEMELALEEEAEVASVSAATAGSMISDVSRELFRQEQELLEKMTELAESSRALPDARVRRLVEWIKENMCPALSTPGAKWNNIRVILFTEYDDTKRYLQQQLTAALYGSDRAEERIAIFHGPTPVSEREVIKAAFNADPSKHPLRILIATDAAREGLNLQVCGRRGAFRPRSETPSEPPIPIQSSGKRLPESTTDVVPPPTLIQSQKIMSCVTSSFHPAIGRRR